MKHLLLRKNSWIGIILLVFSLAACNGDDDVDNPDSEDTLSCGTGTVLDNGECVVRDFGCDEGEVPSPTGLCLSPGEFCGAEAQYDSATEKCVTASDISCGEGTIEVDRRCEVEDAVACGEGTVLAEGQCRISEDVCGDGTELTDLECILTEDACSDHAQFDVITGECVDLTLVECGDNTLEISGECIPSGTALDELAAQAEVDFSDNERTLTPGTEAGDTLVFTGTMTTSPNLYHVFPFEGEEGVWLSITIYPRGLPSVGFQLRQIIGSWERRVVPDLTSLAHRTVVPPASANYDLIIETSVSGMDGLFGDDSWSYVGVIEVLETPEATPWDIFAEPIGGNLVDTTSNLREIELEAGEQAVIQTEALGADLRDSSMQVWTTPLDFSEEFDLTEDSTIVLEGDGLVYLLFDAQEFRGARTNFGVSAQQTFLLEPGETTEQTISAVAGELLRISHRSTTETPLAGRVMLGNDEVFYDDSILVENKSSYTRAQTRREFLYIQEDGDYIVEFENTSASTVEGFLATSSTTDPPPLFSPDGAQNSSFDVTIPADGLERGDWRFLFIDNSDFVRITGTVESGDGNPDVVVFDADRNTIASYTTSGSSETLDFDLPEAGLYVIAIQPNSTLSGDITVALDSTPVSVLEPQEMESFTFSAAIFDVLSGEISYRDGGAPSVRLFNPDGAIVFESLEAPTTLDLLELIPGNGDYTLEVINEGAEPTIGLSIEFELETPIDILTVDDQANTTNLARPDLLAQGERELILLRTLNSVAMTFLVALGDTEEATLRVYDMDSGQVILSGTNEGDIELSALDFQSGTFLIEIEALSDLENGYDFSLSSFETTLYEVSQSDLELAASSTNFLSVDATSCPTLLSVEVYIRTGFGIRRTNTEIDLISPEGEEYRIFGPGSGINAIDTTFPTETDTVDSLDPLIGENGVGTWDLRLVYNSTNTPTVQNWRLSVLCN